MATPSITPKDSLQQAETFSLILKAASKWESARCLDCPMPLLSQNDALLHAEDEGHNVISKFVERLAN